MKHQMKSAAQQELDYMRQQYAQRMHDNQPRRDRMIGAILILCGIIALSLLVIAFNI